MGLLILHVVARGVRRGLLFEDETGFQKFLDLAGKYSMEMGVTIIDYCLMDNHYHLLVSCTGETKSKFLQRLNGSYAITYNIWSGRTGHVFEERTKAFDRWGSILTPHVSRYIGLNPVKAGLVGLPEEHRWSAYSSIIGLKPRPDWLNPKLILDCFSPDPIEAQRLYRMYVTVLIDGMPEMREASNRWLERHQDNLRARNRMLAVDFAAMTSAVVDCFPIVHELDPQFGFDDLDFKVYAMRQIAEATQPMMAAILDVSQQAVQQRESRLARLFRKGPEIRSQIDAALKDTMLFVPPGALTAPAK